MTDAGTIDEAIAAYIAKRGDREHADEAEALRALIMSVAVPKTVIGQILEAARDELAGIEHERWSHWQRYMHGKGERVDGTLVIPREYVDRWDRQAALGFDDLTEQERDSDREQVDRYLPTIARLLTKSG